MEGSACCVVECWALVEMAECICIRFVAYRARMFRLSEPTVGCPCIHPSAEYCGSNIGLEGIGDVAEIVESIMSECLHVFSWK